MYDPLITTTTIFDYTIFIPGYQRHGNGKYGHALVTQQVIADGVLFAFHATKVQADDHSQPEHECECRVFGHPVQLFHFDEGVLLPVVRHEWKSILIILLYQQQL